MIIFLLSAVCAYLYYFGGEGRKEIRRFGCPIVALFTLLLLGVKAHWYAWIIGYGLMYGTMTTYCKGDAEDVLWYHWLLTGILYGASAIPFVIWGSATWTWFIVRTIVLGIITMIWSEKFNDVFIEALGRGFFFNLTLAFLILR